MKNKVISKLTEAYNPKNQEVNLEIIKALGMTVVSAALYLREKVGPGFQTDLVTQVFNDLPDNCLFSVGIIGAGGKYLYIKYSQGPAADAFREARWSRDSYLGHGPARSIPSEVILSGTIMFDNNTLAYEETSIQDKYSIDFYGLLMKKPAPVPVKTDSAISNHKGWQRIVKSMQARQGREDVEPLSEKLVYATGYIQEGLQSVFRRVLYNYFIPINKYNVLVNRKKELNSKYEFKKKEFIIDTNHFIETTFRHMVYKEDGSDVVLILIDYSPIVGQPYFGLLLFEAASTIDNVIQAPTELFGTLDRALREGRISAEAVRKAAAFTKQK